MAKENIKTLSVEVNKETWKKLKIMSVQRELTLPELIRELLEKITSNKKYDLEENNVAN